jgi:hypothetical protein
MLDMEMLTKGEKKLQRSDAHFQEISQKVRDKVNITMINSDDATTWAQKFVMPVFGAVFSRILPSDYIEPFMFILNLVTNKQLELPSKLLDLFENNRDIESFDPSMVELKRQYLGQSVHQDLVKVKNRFLQNKSNMMQGILHYTSSIVHCGYILLWENYSKDRIKHDLQNVTFDMKITSKVSSDDSCLILSFE